MMFVVCCMINNLTLRHDGLDCLWEDGVNWKTLNPNVNVEEEEEEDICYHDDSEDYIPTFLNDVLPQDFSESDRFKYFQILLAKNLHFTYKAGKLQWPLTRAEIKKKYNALPRIHFPQGTELNFDV